MIGKDRDLVAPPNYLDWKSQNAVFDALGAYRVNGFALTGAGEPESLTAIMLSSSLFRVLGVAPLVGRTFTEEEEARRDRVVVLRHEFWQRRFGGDRRLVGKAITLTGAAFTVIGVMPPSFRFPEGVPADMYSPLVFAANELAGRRTALADRARPPQGWRDHRRRVRKHDGHRTRHRGRRQRPAIRIRRWWVRTNCWSRTSGWDCWCSWARSDSCC